MMSEQQQQQKKLFPISLLNSLTIFWKCQTLEGQIMENVLKMWIKKK